ncbi:MAG: hypothetical protein ACTSRP_05515 [Candidatus Helarchaeota archaeon]
MKYNDKISKILDIFQKELQKRNNTYERILKWKKLAEEEKDDIIKRFIFRWISFNGLYKVSYVMDHDQEKADNEREIKLIESFCDKFIVTDKNLASKIFSENLKKIFEEKITIKSRNMGTYLTHIKCREIVEIKAKNMVFISYKIRCRLFHGEKNPNLNVNLEVIKAADQIIETILNYIIR